MAPESVGAVPLEIAVRADSAAHRALDEVRERGREQGERNRTFSTAIKALEADVHHIKGAVSMAKWLIPLAMTIGLAVAGAIGKFVH